MLRASSMGRCIGCLLYTSTGWFYHQEEDTDVRTADELLDIYLDAVGANASLLLNIPPDTHGRIDAPD